MTRIRAALAVLAVALGLAVAAPARAQEMQANPYSFLSAASTNSTLLYPGSSLLQNIIVINTTSTQYFLKIYNKATAPTCGTDTPALRIPIPPTASGGGVVAMGTGDMKFPLGVGVCLTGAIADNDSTVAATGVALNFGIVPQ